MEAKDVKLGKVLSGNEVFIVPLFQRPYVWERERNWEPLRDDLQHAAEEVEAEQAGRSSVDPPTYFLGAFVTQERPRIPRRLPSSHVIDGQQRLTTLQILFAAVRAVATRLAHLPTAGRFEELVRNSDKAVYDDSPDDQHKLIPLPMDREAYRWAVRGPDRQEDDPPSQAHLLVTARTWFERVVQEWVQATEQRELRRLGVLASAEQGDATARIAS